MAGDLDMTDHGDRPVGDGVDRGVDRPSLTISHSPDGTRVIRVGASLDATAAAELRCVVNALLARSTDPLVVDLAPVRAAEPVASAVLREMAYQAGAADVDLRVVRDPDTPRVAGVVLADDTLFELFPTLEAALQRPADASSPQPRPHPGSASPPGETP